MKDDGGGQESIANDIGDEGGANKQEDFKVARPPASFDTWPGRLLKSNQLTPVWPSTADLVHHQRCPWSAGSSPDPKTG